MVYPFPRPFPGPSILKSFSVLSLFSSGEQGAWYDPSDFLPNWRLNLLTRTEELSNAAWVSGPISNGTRTNGSVSISNSEGYCYIRQSATLDVAADHSISFELTCDQTISSVPIRVAGTTNPSALVNFTANVAQRVSLTGFKPGAAYIDIGIDARDAIVPGGSNATGYIVTFNKVDLRLASNASVSPTYQKITDGIQDYFTYQPQPVMFTDAAGTTPVTAVEQPVGLLLDKSKGGRQSLAVTGWAKNSGDGTVTVDGNTITITGATTTTRVDIVAPGWAVGDYADITVTGSVAGATGQILYLGGGTLYSTLSGTNTFRNVIASSTLLRLQISTGSATFVVTSRGFVPGNHASQSTAASRPVLSARVNQLTYSEQFDNAAWTKFRSSVSANTNATTDPLGGNTADKLIPSNALANGFVYNTTSVSGVSGVAYTASIYVKAAELGFAFVAINNRSSSVVGGACINLTTGELTNEGANGTFSRINAGNGWWQIFCTATNSSTANYIEISPLAVAGTYGSYTGDGTSGIYLWGADLRVTNVGVNLPAYQRVGAATDYDTSNFPLYLKFDGIDDSLATGTIDFSATDKMSVFAGVRKLSDIGDQAAIETSSAASANNGTISLFAPVSSGTNYNFGSRGTTFRSTSATGFAAPITTVVTGLSDISGDSVVIRANGSQASSSILDQGTGNYGNYPLYIGRRNNATLPYNGRLYSLIVRGAQSTDAQIASTETWVNGKTGAY